MSVAPPYGSPFFVFGTDPQAAEPGHEPPFNGERLLTAAGVAAYLNVQVRKVYALPIPRVELSPRRVRWLESDVLA